MKITLIRLLIVICSCALAVVSCREKEKAADSFSTIEQKGNAVKTVQPPGGKIEQEAKEKKDAMVASINGTVITSREVEREVDNFVMQRQGRFSPEQLQQMRPSLREQALETLINRLLLLQEASRKKIQPDVNKIDAEINMIAGRFDSPDMFQKQLTIAGITEKDLRDQIEQKAIIDILLKDIIAGVGVVTDAEINGFYKDNPENFKVPEQVHPSHILLKVSPDDSPEVKEQKRLEIISLKDRIEKGAAFDQLARDHSECPSKEQGGDMGFFTRGKMVKPFEEAAFNLKVGDVSEIVETQFGFHLIKLVERKQAKTMLLAEVRDKISEHLKNQKEGQVVSSYLEELRKGAKIEYAKGIQ